MSLKHAIIEYLNLHYPNWIHGGEIERLAMREGKKAANGGRRCRELVNQGLIEKKLDEKGCVWYKLMRREEIKPNPVFSATPLFEFRKFHK